MKKYMVLTVDRKVVYLCSSDGVTYTILRIQKIDSDVHMQHEIGEKHPLDVLRTDLDRYDFETIEEAEKQMLLEML